MFRAPVLYPSGISNSRFILARSAVQIINPANLLENVLARITVPANSIGPEGAFQTSFSFVSNSSPNNKTMRIRFGGTAIVDITRTVTTIITSANPILFNRGVTNSQISSSSLGLVTTQPLATSNVDTTQDQELTFTAQLANVGDTITLERFLIIFYPGF